MKNKTLAIFLYMLLCLLNLGCVYSVARYDGPYEGRVVDAETGSPIEGVVVLGVWYKEEPTVAGATSSFYDAKEISTDKDGYFSIHGKGLKIMSKVAPVSIVIFKVGYDHLNASWNLFKENDSYKTKIKWEGKRAIIPLRKLSLEERRNRLGDYYIPGIPDGKRKLLLQEIDREDKEIGR